MAPNAGVDGSNCRSGKGYCSTNWSDTAARVMPPTGEERGGASLLVRDTLAFGEPAFGRSVIAFLAEAIPYP